MRNILIIILVATCLPWALLARGDKGGNIPRGSNEENTKIDLIVELERTFKYISPTEVWVNILVKKNGIDGFARFVDSFSSGYTVGEVNAETGTVISEKGRLKIIWMKLPDNDDLKISYKLKGKDLFLFGCMVEGRFSYLTDGHPVQIDLAPVFYYGRNEGFDNGTGEFYPEVWKNPFIDEDFSEDTVLSKKQELILNLQKKFEEAENTKHVKTEEVEGIVFPEDDELADSLFSEEFEEISTEKGADIGNGTTFEVEEEEMETPNDDGNRATDEEENRNTDNLREDEEENVSAENKSILVYRIQLIVGKYKLPDNYFEEKYKIEEPVFIEKREDSFVYTVGNFNNFEAASSFKEVMKDKGLTGAFVIAYINEQPVSIQKALKFESK